MNGPVPVGAPPSSSPSSSSSPPSAMPRPARAPYDPLRLCVYATVALLAWLLGPFAVVGFAGLGFAGYWRARRAGLTRSKCFLRDTRLVLSYLAALGLAGLVGVAWYVHGWLV